MDVIIFEKESGKIIATIPIAMGGLNYVPTESEYFKLAWKAAVADGVVDEKNPEKYQFNISK